MTRWVLGLGVLAFLISAVRAGEDAAVWRPYAGYLPDQDWTQAAVLLVRDARTGMPIEGARVRRCPEPVYDPESGWGPVWEETFTDEYGLAWVELDKEDVSYFLDPRTGDWVRHEDSTWTAHWVVDAPGYAPTEEYGDSVQEVIDLQPGIDVHGRIVDVFGRPAVGVKVEFKLGCAHAPSLRTAFTDRRGRFALPCIRFNADLCYEGPGVRAQYSAPGNFAPTDLDVPTVIADPAGAIVGRIVGPPRAWLAEASVQSRTSSRGPIARVSPDGWFRLEGASRREGLWLLHPDGPDEIEATLSPRDYRQGRPIVWHHPDPKTEVEPVEVTVRVRGVRPDVWPDSLTIYFDRLRDGRRFRVEAELDGEPTAEAVGELPPGTYELSAGGPFDAFVAPPRSVGVKADGNATYVLDVAERPRLEAVGRYELPEGAMVVVCLADCEEFVPDEEEGGVPHLPAHAEAAVVVRHLDGARSFPVGPVVDGVRRATIDWPLPTVVEVRGFRYGEGPYDEEGAQPRVGWMETQPPMEDDPVDEEGGFSFRTYREGRVRLTLVNETRGKARIDLDLPPPAGEHVVVEGARFAPGRPGELRIDGFAGPEADYRYLEVRHAGDHDYPESDEEGVFRSPLLRDGAYIHVENHREVLSGPGPYRVVLPTGVILLEVEAEGTCKSPEVYVDGRMWRVEAETDEGPWVYRISGLAAGRHRLIVGAEKHRAMRTDVHLAEGEERRLSVTLPLLPEADPRRGPQTEGEWWALLDDLDDDAAIVRARARKALIAAGDSSLPWLIGRVARDQLTYVTDPAPLALLVELRPELKELLAPATDGGVPPERLDALTLWRQLSAWRVRPLDAWVELLRTKTLRDPMRASAQGHHARLALASMGAASLPRLVELLGDPEPRVRFWTIRSIVGNAAADDAVLSALTARLRDDDEDVRRTTRDALLRLAKAGHVTIAPDRRPGPVGDSIVHGLLEPTAIEDTLVLLRYFPPTPSSNLVARLMALLDEKPAYHDPVIEVLGQLGATAKAALPRLERIIETSDSWRTIDLAEEAIRRIRER